MNSIFLCGHRFNKFTSRSGKIAQLPDFSRWILLFYLFYLDKTSFLSNVSSVKLSFRREAFLINFLKGLKKSLLMIIPTDSEDDAK